EDPPARCYLDAFDAIARDPNQLLLLAEQDRRVVGCLQLTFIPGLSRQGAWRGQIEGVRIASDQRGAGLGRLMIEHAIAECRARGCSLVQLTTDKSRTDAKRFYEGLGFVASHEGMKLGLG
ncbi:MAG TPA: GNAT family N-acetyltransferase, partial [Saliniramus sp.]|nr:GNAT family N-acetyltransferase [Saliniramus sp.]